MTAKYVLYLLLHVFWTITAQHNPYSLQTAVDALHRRETQLALKDYENSRSESSAPSGYFEPLPDVSQLQKQQELNQLLARYLDNDDEPEREAYGPEFEDDQFMEERKRSMFREREELPYQSVFREREVIQPDLASEFLKEIDRERNAEREEKYKETLRRLWEKYQQQENEIEEDLFTEEKPDKIPAYEMKMAPRPQYISAGNRPEYFGSVVEKRRLTLPWMPATRRKRFPVAKRSPKYTKEDARTSGTDAKVAKDLQAIFNEPIDVKKKRSSGNEQRPTPTATATSAATTTSSAPTVAHRIEKKSDHSTKSEEPDSRSHDHDHNNNHDLDHDGDLDEHAHEHTHEHDHEDHDHDHDHHEHDHDEDEDDDDFEDDDEDDKKKKRAIIEAKRSNPEILKEDQIIPGDLSDFRRKKSVQWSKYFGIDRRKKSADWFSNNGAIAKPESLDDYAPKHFRNHDQVVSRANLELNEKKLDNMDLKLKSIEDLIIDETIKYTGAHEGVTNPEDIQHLKDHVISRLATAYSLEKMRRALDKLKQSVDKERHLEHNEIDSSQSSTLKDNESAVDKAKRVAIKKEKVQFDNNHHVIEPAPEKVIHDVANNALELPEEDKKKKKSVLPHQYPAADYNELKHLGQRPYMDYNEMGEFEGDDGVGHFEPMNEGYMGGPRENNIGQCPVLDAMEKRCRGIDLLSGDIHQDLLPVCGIHQICYLCGTSQTACDMQYLTEADGVCGHNKECQSAARSALMILRGTPGPQLGPRECSKNRCLYQAMREIGGI